MSKQLDVPYREQLDTVMGILNAEWSGMPKPPPHPVTNLGTFGGTNQNNVGNGPIPRT